MWRRVLKLSMSPRVLLRSVLALDDSPHSIALGTAIGIFVGLTPSVGIQTILILAIVFLTRPFFYFNGTAAMASTYISNPLTMAPLYYFWYRLGAWFFPGYSTNVNLSPLLEFDSVVGWWQATCGLAIQVGLPMLTGALLTAPFGAALSYPLTHLLVRWFRNSDDLQPPRSGGGNDTVPQSLCSARDAGTTQSAPDARADEASMERSSDIDNADAGIPPACVTRVAAGR